MAEEHGSDPCLPIKLVNDAPGIDEVPIVETQAYVERSSVHCLLGSQPLS